MCGIAGIINDTNSPGANLQVMQNMLRVQHHRGPDDTSTWQEDNVTFGHNRLSIIDLSEAANQPMHYDQQVLVFNGEIYNYVELRKELTQNGHVFKTQSDTEVILHAWKQWGKNCVNHFSGMWAFAIWDRQSKILFASRDRFGIKPFYYIHEGKSLAFASEIKTLRPTPLFSNDINLLQVSRGLQMGWLGYHDETWFNCVKALPAGCNMIFNDGNTKVERYWKPVTGIYTGLSFSEKKEKFYELFNDCIRLHMRSDVPVGSCLSGGLDSSSIVSMVQKQQPGMSYKTFSIYYDGDGDVDEREFINEVTGKFPALEPYYFSPSDDDVAAAFDHALYHADVPVSGSSFISQYFLMKLIASKNIRVVLDGQGADEYLAGYMHSFYRLIGGMLIKMHPAKAVKTTLDINRRMGKSITASASHFGKSLLASVLNEQQLYALEYKKYYPFMTCIDNEPPFNLEDVDGSRLDAFLYHLLFTTSLPSLLHYEDRNSMAFSIESRVPFLDHKLVEFAFGLQDEDKINGTDTKYILRESLQQILPGKIYARKDKKGFVTPGENKWLRGPLRHLVDDNVNFPDFIQREKAASLLKDYKNGDNSKAILVWRLAVLREWLKKN